MNKPLLLPTKINLCTVLICENCAALWKEERLKEEEKKKLNLFIYYLLSFWNFERFRSFPEIFFRIIKSLLYHQYFRWHSWGRSFLFTNKILGWDAWWSYDGGFSGLKGLWGYKIWQRIWFIGFRLFCGFWGLSISFLDNVPSVFT